MKLQEGTVLDDRFRIIKLLGVGGMGSVYLAEQIDLSRQVALKVFAAEQFDDDDRERFIREGKILSELRNPGIVAFYNFSIAESLAFFSMEYVRGQSLRQLLNDHTRFAWQEALPLVRKICTAMESAHITGVVHRDLKPENILIAEGDEKAIKIIDFGLGRFSTKGNTLTATGMLMGSPKYMSPEQCQGQKASTASDIYSVGIILYELITGEPPFSADTAFGIFHKHINENWIPLQTKLPKENFPAGLDLVLEKSLAKLPENRYSDFNSMANDLELILDGRGDQIAGTRENKSNGKILKPILLVALSCIIFFGVAHLLTLRKQTKNELETKFKTISKKTKRNLEFCKWEEIQSISSRLAEHGAFLEARQTIKDWLSQRPKIKPINSETEAQAAVMLTMIMLSNNDSLTAFEFLNQTFDSLENKGSDSDISKVICARIGVSESDGNLQSCIADQKRLRTLIKNSKTLSDEDRWYAYKALLEARDWEGHPDEALKLLTEAAHLAKPSSIQLEKIRLLYKLNRVSEAQHLAEAYLRDSVDENRSPNNALEVAEEVAHAQRWQEASQILLNYLNSRGQLNNRLALMANSNGKEGQPSGRYGNEIAYLQNSTQEVKEQASLLSSYAQYSMNAWGDANNAGPILGRKLNQEKWLNAVRNSCESFSQARQLKKARGDEAGYRTSLAHEYCCMCLLGQKKDAEKMLGKALADRNAEEIRATLAGVFWSISHEWSALGWKPEHIIPLKKAAKLYALSPGHSILESNAVLRELKNQEKTYSLPD